MLFFYHFFYCFYCNEVVFWPLIHTAAHFHHNFMVHLHAYNSRPFALCAWVNNDILPLQPGGVVHLHNYFFCLHAGGGLHHFARFHPFAFAANIDFITGYFYLYFLHGAKIRKNHLFGYNNCGKCSKIDSKPLFCVQKRVEKAKKGGQNARFQGQNFEPRSVKSL